MNDFAKNTVTESILMLLGLKQIGQKGLTLGVGIALLVLTTAPSEARTGLGRGGYSLSAAGGIVSSSKNLAAFQNPAALIYGDSLDIDLQLMDTGSGDLGFGGGLMFGGMDWGGVVGLQHLSHGAGTTRAYYGIAGTVRQFKTAFGISGRTEIDGGSGTTIDIGALINPTDPFRVGLTAFGVNDGFNAFGAGVAYDLSSSITLLADGTAANDADLLALAPGIRIGNQNAAATLSYGLKAKGATFSSPVIHEEVMAGFTLKLGKVQWAGYYQQPAFARYYTTVTFDF